MLTHLHQRGIDLTSYLDDGIGIAITEGHLDVIKYLDENGVDVTLDDEAICHAAGMGYLDMIEYLNGKSPDIATDKYILLMAIEND